MSSIIWFSGLSGSGKTTLAVALANELKKLKKSVIHLDGDGLRQGLNSDLGFNEADRRENIRRASQVAKLLCDQDQMVIVSMITPLEELRELVRATLSSCHYLEVFVDCPLTICMERDPKGLYQKALKGEIVNMTGIQAPFEVPQNAHLTLLSADSTVSSLVDTVLAELKKSGAL